MANYEMMDNEMPTKRPYHRPKLIKHGTVNELTLTYGHYDVENVYGHVHTWKCGHNGGMPGS